MHLLLHALTTAINSIMEQTNNRLDAFKWVKMLQPGCRKFNRISRILNSLHWLPAMTFPLSCARGRAEK